MVYTSSLLQFGWLQTGVSLCTNWSLPSSKLQYEQIEPLITFGDNIAVYPEISVILNSVKDPAQGLLMRRLRDPSLRSG